MRKKIDIHRFEAGVFDVEIQRVHDDLAFDDAVDDDVRRRRHLARQRDGERLVFGVHRQLTADKYGSAGEHLQHPRIYRPIIFDGRERDFRNYTCSDFFRIISRPGLFGASIFAQIVWPTYIWMKHLNLYPAYEMRESSLCGCIIRRWLFRTLSAGSQVWTRIFIPLLLQWEPGLLQPN